MRYAEDGLYPLFGDERRMLEYMLVLNVDFERYDGAIEERLRRIPNGWRDWRNVRARLNKLIGQIMETLPTRDLRRIEKGWRSMEIVIRPKSAVYSADYMTAPVKEVERVIQYAIDGECAMCLKEGREIKACGLRRALMEIAPPRTPKALGCEYRDFAGREGKDFG